MASVFENGAVVYFQKNVVPQMQSLSQMFDKAGGGYDCPSTNCNENDVSTSTKLSSTFAKPAFMYLYCCLVLIVTAYWHTCTY